MLIRVLLISLALATPVSAAESSSQTYPGIPDYLKDTWDLVLIAKGPNDVIASEGMFVTGNNIAALSLKPKAKLKGEFRWFSVSAVKQLNVREPRAESGFITVFELRGEDGTVVLEPGYPMSTVAVKPTGAAKYEVYGVMKCSLHQDEIEAGRFESTIETWKALLGRQYESLSKGLE